MRAMTTPYDASPTPDATSAQLTELTAALLQLSKTIEGFHHAVIDFNTVIERADALVARAEVALAPLAATQQVGDQIKVASQLAGQVASAAVKRGVAAGKGLTQRT
jgi:hypothetical protein